MFIAHSTRTMANAKFKLGKVKDDDVRVTVIYRATAEQARREADRARRIRKHQEHIAAIRAQELAPVMERIALLNRATSLDMRAAAAIVASVSKAEGIDIVDVMGTDRTHAIADARHRCIAEIRSQTGLSLKQIGGIFGLDHSTVAHAVSKMNGKVRKRRRA